MLHPVGRFQALLASLVMSSVASKLVAMFAQPRCRAWTISPQYVCRCPGYTKREMHASLVALVLQSVTVDSLYAWTGVVTDDTDASNVAIAISSGGSGGSGASTMTFSVTGVT